MIVITYQNGISMFAFYSQYNSVCNYSNNNITPINTIYYRHQQRWAVLNILNTV